MKLFVAKYIEFPGEILQGDLIPFSNLSEPKKVDLIEGEDLYIDYFSGWPLEYCKYPKTKFKKVKLCICSRALKLGDTKIYSITTKNGSVISNIKNASFEKILPNGRAYLTWGEHSSASCEYPFEIILEPNIYGHTNDIYKVLGTISDQAGWVKENMEFDAEDIAWISDDGEDTLHPFPELLAWFEKEAEGKIPSGPYALKGPCGHFH